MMQKVRGFTLIELMIVVVIVGILAAVAVPSYRAYVDDGRRSEGQAFAMDIASRQERHWTQNSTYAGSNFVADLGLTNSDLSENGEYKATMPASGDSFTVRVSPEGWTDSQCGYLELTNTGKRSSQVTNSDCWK